MEEIKLPANPALKRQLAAALGAYIAQRLDDGTDARKLAARMGIEAETAAEAFAIGKRTQRFTGEKLR